jgi:hypothetical protein
VVAINLTGTVTEVHEVRRIVAHEEQTAERFREHGGVSAVSWAACAGLSRAC